jgi:type II restriction enzyme
MPKLKTSDIVKAINKLTKNKAYKYYTGNTFIKITEIIEPEGPISFLRWRNNETEADAKSGSVSINQLATAAAVFSNKPNHPINFDRLFSASGNSRAAFESLLAHTPHFFICYPERTNIYTGETESRIKHILWSPDNKHKLGEIGTTDFQETISEVEFGVDFGNIHVGVDDLSEEFDTIEAKRTHTQMQVALIEIGNALGLKTWIAKNDYSIKVGNSSLGELEGVIQSLDEIKIFFDKDIKRAASLIDCIWFTPDYKYVPAIFEVEHSTGVTSGLTRMLKFRETIPSLSTNYVVVAPIKTRNKVVAEANNQVFKKLNAKFLGYPNIRLLYGLVQKFSLNNLVDRNFIKAFWEQITNE